MLDRLKKNLKKNKGYYTLILADTTVGSVITGVTFALINLPLAIAVSVLNFGVNVAAGIIMTPKQGQASEPAVAESAAVLSTGRDPKLKRASGFYKKFRKFQMTSFRDPVYTVESAASGAGITLLFQAILGIKSVLATHSILFLTAIAPPVGIAVGATLAAIGLFGVIAGNMGKWKGISKYYTAAFQKAGTEPAPEKMHRSFVKKFAERPRMQKLLNSRWSKETRKFTLMAMTVESAIFTLIAAPAVMVKHIAAMAAGPHAILTGIIPLAIAVNWVRGPAWHAISAGRILAHDALHIKSKIRAKKAAQKIAAPASAPAPVATHLDPSAKPLADTFGKVAGQYEAKDALATSAAKAKPPVNPPAGP